MINNLKEYNIDDGHLIGNKAINLLKLMKCDIAVPETWIYESTVPIRLLEDVGLYHNGVYLKDFKAAYKYFDNLPKNILQNIKHDVEQYLHKGIGPLVLRSSNSEEDVLNKSFAGAFMSKINISKTMSIVDAIIEIWKSSFSDIVYELCLKYGIRKIMPCAVIFQNLINAEVGGIAVKANDKCIIHAGFGLTKGAVDDVFDPDCWVVNDDGTIIDEIKGKKLKGVYPIFTHTTPLEGEKFDFIFANQNFKGTVCSIIDETIVTVKIPNSVSQKKVLNNEQICNYYNIFECVGESCEKNSYDIEWCVDYSGKLFLLQIRDVSNTISAYKKGKNAMPLVAGTATGIVRYVGKNEDVHNFPNDLIILTKKIDGTVLHAISKAKGCIIETTEILSHSAIIARELGIPSIGVEDISLIEQDMPYYIDGNKGEYYEIEQKDTAAYAHTHIYEDNHEKDSFQIVNTIADHLIIVPSEWDVVEGVKTRNV